MLIPSVLPNEASDGYWGRIACTNGYMDLELTNKALLKALYAVDQRRSHSRSIAILADAANVSTATFIQQHTTILLQGRNLFTDSYHDLEYDDYSFLAVNNSDMGRRDGAYLCLQCIESDIEEFGESYWHRDHQIPGVYWCHIHRTVLDCVKAQHPFKQSPGRFLDRPAKPLEWIFTGMDDYPVIRHFLKLARAMASCHRILHINQVFSLSMNLIGNLPWRADGYRTRDMIDVAFSAPSYKFWFDSILGSSFPQHHSSARQLIDNFMGYTYLTNTLGYIMTLAILTECFEKEVGSIMAIKSSHSFRWIDAFRPYQNDLV